MNRGLEKRLAKLGQTLQVDDPVRFIRIVFVSHEGRVNGPLIQVSGPRQKPPDDTPWPTSESIREQMKAQAAARSKESSGGG